MEKANSTGNELFADFPDIMTVHHLRAALGIGRLGAYKLLEGGKINSFKIGNTYKIPKSAVIEYVRHSCKEGAETK